LLNKNKIQEVINELHLQITNNFGIENETEDDCKCMICLNKEGHIIKANCGHYYCLEQLFNWLRTNDSLGNQRAEKCLYCFKKFIWNECILKI
jgi:hypothetical protein